MRYDAFIFNKDIKYRDISPFFVAVSKQLLWAVELFCDHGVDLNTRTSTGVSPLLYAA